MAGRNKGRQDSNRQTSAQTKDRQARQQADILVGRTATDKTGRRDCNRKMGADDRLAERQTDQNRQMDRMTDRQTSVITESQTGKMAGRNKGRQQQQANQRHERKTDRQNGGQTYC